MEGFYRESDLVAIFTEYTSLEYVFVRFTEELTDEALNALSMHCPDLISLDMACSTGFTAVGILALIKNAKNLSYLTLKSPEDDQVWLDVAIAQWEELYPNLCIFLE